MFQYFSNIFRRKCTLHKVENFSRMLFKGLVKSTQYLCVLYILLKGINYFINKLVHSLNNIYNTQRKNQGKNNFLILNHFKYV